MKNMLNEVLSEVGGPLGDLLKKLSGSDGDLWLTELKKFLRKEQTWKEKTVLDLLKRRERIVRGFALVLGICLLTAFASFMSYMTTDSSLALVIGQSSVIILSSIVLFSCASGLAGLDSPGFVPLGKYWAHDIGAEFPTYAVFYLGFFPLMSYLFITCLSGIFGFHVFSASKPINDPETWEVVAWTTAIYAPVLAGGLIWRFVRLSKRRELKKNLGLQDLLNH